MDSKNVNNSSVSHAKTLRIVLSPKVVREFFVRSNGSPNSNRMQEVDGRGSAPTANNTNEPIRKRNFHDSEINDSDGKRPIIVVDRIGRDEMRKISMFGYLQSSNQVNGY